MLPCSLLPIFTIAFYGCLAGLVLLALLWLTEAADPPSVPDSHPRAQSQAVLVDASSQIYPEPLDTRSRIPPREASGPYPLSSRPAVLVDTSSQIYPGPLGVRSRITPRELVSSKVSQVSEDNDMIRRVAAKEARAVLGPAVARLERLQSDNGTLRSENDALRSDNDALRSRLAAAQESSRGLEEEAGWIAQALGSVMSSIETILLPEPAGEPAADSDADDSDSDYDYDSESDFLSDVDEPEPAGQENVSGKRVCFARKRTFFRTSKWIIPSEHVHRQRTREEVQREIEEQEFLENDCF